MKKYAMETAVGIFVAIGLLCVGYLTVKLGMDAEAQQAQVEMLIRKDIRIYEDALAAIKTEGLIGDKYVSIDPGGIGEPLKPGGSIIQTQAAVDVGDLISKYAFGDVKKEEPEKK